MRDTKAGFKYRDGEKLIMDGSKVLAALLALTLLAGTAAASCPLLSVAVDNVAVERPAAGVFTVTVTNNAPGSDTIRFSSVCDPNVLQCGFTDVTGPMTIAAGATTVAHLSIPTSQLANGAYPLTVQVWGGVTGQCTEERQLTLTVTSPGVSPTPSASPQPITATINPVGDTTVKPGDSFSHQIYVRNNLAETAVIRVATTLADRNPFSTTISPNEFVLGAGESKTIDAKSFVAVGTPTNVFNFVYNVRATTASGNVYAYDLPVRVFIYSQSLNLRITSAPAQCTTAFHNRESTAEFTIQNYGEITGSFYPQITTSDAIRPYIKASDTVMDIKTDETRTLRLTFKPTTSVATATYAYTLDVTYGDYNAATFTGCVSIQPVSGIEALDSKDFTVVRGQVTRIPFHISNNGSVTNAYSFNWNPYPQRGLSFVISPSQVALAAGDSKDVDLVMQADSTVVLGRATIPFTIYSNAGPKAVSVKANIVAGNGTDSPLRIVTPDSSVYAAVPNQKTFRVYNYGPEDYSAVAFWLEGIPSEEYTIKNPVRPIKSMGSSDYTVTFQLPPERDGQNLAYDAVAAAGLESVKKSGSLSIMLPETRLGFEILDVVPNDARDASKGVRLKLVVSNQGNTQINGVAVSLPSNPDYNVAPERNPVLAPGGSQYLYVQITPNAPMQSQDVAIRLKAPDGTTTQKVLRLPAMGADQGPVGNDDAWKIVAIIVIFAAILAVISREELGDLMKGK